jgi:hypothetical protein
MQKQHGRAAPFFKVIRIYAASYNGPTNFRAD